MKGNEWNKLSSSAAGLGVNIGGCWATWSAAAAAAAGLSSGKINTRGEAGLPRADDDFLQGKNMEGDHYF